jgi:hypothetical protein
MCPLATIAKLPCETACVANCQTQSPAQKNSGYGMPSLGIRTRRPKKTLKTTIRASGCSIAQAMPTTVWP